MVATLSQNSAAHQEAINGRLYRDSNLVRYYSGVKLSPPEAVALVRYGAEINGQTVLDLGCGAGRLAAYLRPLIGHYVGVDVSEHMVAYCQRAFPELEFQQGDMRQLTGLKTAAFDVVFAVANLFDAVSHAERLQVLTEVRRVLVPGGLLIFSAHNRNDFHAGAGPTLQYTRNPLKQVQNLFEYLQARSNHRRIQPLQQFAEDFALINDSGNNYHTLHYYITQAAQRVQLQDAGFEVLECLDEQGRTLQTDDDDSLFNSLHYVARRGA